ncbi:MAG: hypothetical protein FWE37_02630 [Spirochaetaceae bacterium]|nr:hypothetical protein [Spirochaetaceae bacterium]
MSKIKLIYKPLDSSEKGLQAYTCHMAAFGIGYDFMAYLNQFGHKSLLNYFFGVTAKIGDKEYKLDTSFSVLSPDDLANIFVMVGKERGKTIKIDAISAKAANYSNLTQSTAYSAYTAMVLDMAIAKPTFLTDVVNGLSLVAEPAILIDIYTQFKAALNSDTEQLARDITSKIEACPEIVAIMYPKKEEEDNG